MKYIKSEREYDTTIIFEKGSRKISKVFQCRRIYTDTGNIAQTGYTPIEDGDYKFLYDNCKQFKNLCDTGKFVLSDTDGATQIAAEVEALADENKDLKEKVEKLTKQASTGVALSEDNEALKKENDELKAQIEALVNGDKKAPAAKQQPKGKDKKGEF